MPVNVNYSGLQDALVGLANPNFDQFRGSLSAMAEGLTNELFGPGGPVEQATTEALRGTVKKGFGPQSGGFTSARQNILAGARNQVTNQVAQGALSLVPFALQQQESIFGGRATIENLRLAAEQMNQNERLLDKSIQQSGCGIGRRLGAGLQGGLAGSILPGIGTATGAILGGLAGLFGGC